MQINWALENYLKSEILPQVAYPPYGEIDAVRISKNRPVYLYRDKSTNAKIVGKYYRYGSIDSEYAWHKAEKEYFNLIFVRDQIGMKNNHYNVIAPLGRNKDLSSLLMLEKARGKTLDHYIMKAIYENQSETLFFKLGDLARFFARLHRNSESGKNVPPNLPQWYLENLKNSLRYGLPGFSNHEGEINYLAGTWWNRDRMFDDHEVIVHGDATPTNFLFHYDKVTGIDLEKMKLADRCWDLGFIAAELKHHFMWRTGDGQRAEPYTGHFLWQYASAIGNTNSFYNLTYRLPLYMALGLLRIARNEWLDENYRNKLTGEAILCLKYKP